MEEFRSLARDWCKKEGINPNNAILLRSRNLNASNRTLLISLMTGLSTKIKGLVQRERIVSGIAETHILCEFCEDACNLELGEEDILHINGDISKFDILLIEGKRDVAVERLYVNDLLSQTELDGLLTQPKNVENKLESRFPMEVITSGKYRRLRFFSGKTDFPKDEDRWETWIEQAESQLDEWGDMSDSERKQKIREALRYPAAEVICDLRQDNPNATSQEYLAALELSFGCTQTGDELLMKFHNLKQKEQESPSDFIRRLQTSLRQVVRKGGIQREQANSTRLRQFIRGLLYDELVITTLQLREKVEEPPKYLQLLNSLRRLEEEKESKQMQRRSRVEVKSATVEPRIAERLADLENQVKMFSFKRQERMEDNTPYIRPNPERVESKRDWMPSCGRRASPDFCFKCGLSGHFQRNCRNSPDLETVNKKLLKLVLGKQENNNGYSRRGNRIPDHQ
ncbi:paraneoplastic antigen Ma3-like [Anneissia japonica]|uniref:paraneoplastic antigen Ma3-like n=1 Tax=Anneissia japonica TaxID=1529436 RepID=UPI001425A039|nr:paraneoplastic antigen Ma3-like [Anneissia japonica]